MPDRFTCSALAPSGTVTKNDAVELRSTEPDERLRVRRLLRVHAHHDRVEHLEVDHRRRRVVDLEQAAGRRPIAGLHALTAMFTALFRGSNDRPGQRNVPSLPTSRSRWSPAGLPLVRVTFTGDLVLAGGLKPPAPAAAPVVDAGAPLSGWPGTPEIGVQTGAVDV